MSQEIVEVIEQGEGGIWVEAVQRSACNSCNARSGCGQHSMSKLGRPMRLWVNTEQKLQPGQQVVLSLPQGSLALSALVMYGLPLLGLIGGAVAGQLTGSDGWAGLAAIGGLGAGFMLARRLAERYQSQWQPALKPGCERIPMIHSEHV